MVYRTQILICNPGKRDTMIMALGKALEKLPPGLVAMSLAADEAGDAKISVLQAWQSKEAFAKFEAAIPPEKVAFFADLVASKQECWHSASLALS